MSEGQKISTFSYQRKDLISEITPPKSGVHFSVFDYLLHQTWDHLMRKRDGPILYPLDSIIKLMPPGKIGYRGAFCPSRKTFKRPAPEFTKVLEQPVDTTKFNFTKVPDAEKLFKIQHVKVSVESEMLVNIAPYERCHALLVTEAGKLKPQVITYEAMVAAFECTLLSTHPGLRVTFNSLGACGTVNHQHFQVYYTPTYSLIIDDFPVKPLGAPLLHKMSDVAALPGWCIKGVDSSNVVDISTKICLFTDLLVQQNIPHNLAICRDSDTGKVQVYIFARKPQENRDYAAFNVAVTELIGHCYYGNRELFDSHTEADISAEIAKARLDSEVEAKLEEQLVAIMDPNSRGILGALFNWF